MTKKGFRDSFSVNNVTKKNEGQTNAKRQSCRAVKKGDHSLSSHLVLQQRNAFLLLLFTYRLKGEREATGGVSSTASRAFSCVLPSL